MLVGKAGRFILRCFAILLHFGKEEVPAGSQVIEEAAVRHVLPGDGYLHPTKGGLRPVGIGQGEYPHQVMRGQDVDARPLRPAAAARDLAEGRHQLSPHAGSRRRQAVRKRPALLKVSVP